MPTDQELRLSIRSLDGKPLQIDDIVLAQSRTTVSQSVVPQSGESWRVGRSALRWQVLANDQELRMARNAGAHDYAALCSRTAPSSLRMAK